MRISQVGVDDHDIRIDLGAVLEDDAVRCILTIR